MGELARTGAGPERFLCTRQIEDDPLNAVYESQQNQWGGFAIKYGILPLTPTFLPLKLTQGARGWTVGSDSG